MYHDTSSLSLKSILIRFAIGLMLLSSPALLLHCAPERVSQNLNDNGALALRDSILQSAIQCYAVEGNYPTSLSYLEKNYGLQINHDRYIVTYNAFASNLVPQVSVLQIQ